MTDYGLAVTEDGFGNIFGKLEGTLPDAPSVIVGSHFDSVPNGGAYDGTAGVVVGLEVAALFKRTTLSPRIRLKSSHLLKKKAPFRRRPYGLTRDDGFIDSNT